MGVVYRFHQDNAAIFRAVLLRPFAALMDDKGGLRRLGRPIILNEVKNPTLSS